MTIRNLRLKLDGVAPGESYIATEYGLGYRLTGRAVGSLARLTDVPCAGERPSRRRSAGLARAARSRPHRTTIDVDGVAVETLADLPPLRDRLLFVGLNPSPVSVEAGHYFQGRLGRPFWRRLITADDPPRRTRRSTPPTTRSSPPATGSPTS